MAQTTAFDANGFAVGGKEEKGRGFFSRFFQSYTEAMEKAGRARAARELGNMSDGHLQALGFTESQVLELRRTGRIPDDFWANRS